MKKTKDIENFFGLVSLLKEYEYTELYNKLIYGDDKVSNNRDALDLIYEKIDSKDKKINDEYIVINEGLDKNDSLMMEIKFIVNLSSYDDTFKELFGYLKKKKIKYYMELYVKNELCDTRIYILDKDYLDKLVDYINDKLGKNLETLNPLLFGDDKVCLSYSSNYSYCEILVMYLNKFFKTEKNLSYSGFKKYIFNNYFKITNQVDMDDFIEFNLRKIELSKFYKDIEIITTLITYLINLKDVEDYKDYFNKLKKEERKGVNPYKGYDDLSHNMELLKELICNMFDKYDLEYTKKSIINYMETGRKDYITRTNNLRKRISESKDFRIFLGQIDLDLEFDRIMYEYNLDNKKKILQDVCKEIYLTSNDLEKCNSGKIQIARTLIRISYGDYSSVTRHNDARKIIKENIKPEEVVNLIKETLQIDYVKKEANLYELYADYIVNLCLL